MDIEDGGKKRKRIRTGDQSVRGNKAAKSPKNRSFVRRIEKRGEERYNEDLEGGKGKTVSISEDICSLVGQ